MESFFARFKNALVLIAVLLAQTIALAVQVRRPVGADEPDGKRVYLLRYWATIALAPFERGTENVGSGIHGIWQNYIDLRHARQQNEELKQQIARMRLEEAAFSEDAIQGHRLQALLNFQQHYISKTVAAQVIGTSGSDLSRTLTLDKGSNDGLKPDMAVITPDGVVGKLRDVFPHSSQLLLLNDQTAGAGVILESTRIRAVVRGTPMGKLQIGNLTPDSRIKPGETVLTSGGDMVFPRGLKVGTIESIAPDPDHQPFTAIVVRPSANLTQLEEVLVIVDTTTSISPEAQKDLAQGAATADAIANQEDSQRTADLLSERLPSLHDIDPKFVDSTSGAKPGDTNGGQNAPIVPRPLPALHPDRYTPGATPPAADLVPGAEGSHTAPVVAQPAPRRAQPANSNTPQSDTTESPQ